MAALNAKDPQLIIDIGNFIVETNRSNAPKKAASKFFNGDFNDQLSYFGEAINDSEFKRCLDHLIEMANSEKTYGELDDLLGAYDGVIKRGGHSVFYRRKIDVLLANDRLAEAMHDLCDCALKGKQDASVKALFRLWEFYASQKNDAGAKACLEQLILKDPTDYVVYLKQAEIEYKTDRKSARACAYFKKAWELKKLKKGKRSNRAQEDDEFKKAENWTFNRLNRFYQTKSPRGRRLSEHDKITFAATLLFCMILIYNFYTNFQLVILLMLVINFVNLVPSE